MVLVLFTVMVLVRLVKSFGDWVESTHPPHYGEAWEVLIALVGATTGMVVGVWVCGWMDVMQK